MFQRLFSCCLALIYRGNMPRLQQLITLKLYINALLLFNPAFKGNGHNAVYRTDGTPKHSGHAAAQAVSSRGRIPVLIHLSIFVFILTGSNENLILRLTGNLCA